MKYNYTIYAEGDIEETTIVSALEAVGLKEIFVEKLYNADEILADQNKFNDENFYPKSERIKKSGIISSNQMIRCSEKNFKTHEVKSMYLLFEGVLNAGIECGIPNHTLGKMLIAMVELLQNGEE